MSSPTSAAARYRPDLQGVRLDFDLEADRMGFIGHRVFPRIEVGAEGGSYRKVTIASLLKAAENIKRTPGAGYARDTWEYDVDTYLTEEYGVEETIDERQKNVIKDLFDVERIAAMRCQDRLLRAYERRVATLAFDQSAFNSASMYLDAVVAWGTLATADPILDVDTAKLAIRAACGMWPNAVIFNKPVMMTLRKTAQFRDRVASTGAGSSTLAGKTTVEQVKEFFDLPNVHIAGAATNSANEGQAPSLGELWSSSYVLVARLAENEGDIEEPCLGRTFHWDGDGSVFEGRVDEYRDEARRGDVIRRRHQTDEVRQIIQCGYLIKVD